LLGWLVFNSSQLAVIGAVMSGMDAHFADPRQNFLQAANALLPALVFVLAGRIVGTSPRTTALGLALVVGAIIAAWVQERWFSHHLFPITTAYFAWWCMAGKSLRWWGHALVALSVLFPVVSQYRQIAHYQKAVGELSLAFDKAGHSLTGKRVGILVMHPSPYNQYIAAVGGLRWNALSDTSYVAAELQPYDRKELAGRAPPPLKLDHPGRRMLHNEVLRLWEDMPPDVLIFDHSTRWPLRYIDVQWTHLFSAEPRFNAFLRHYRPVLAHKGKKLRFVYYVRAD
jgi:hypothetical protein